MAKVLECSSKGDKRFSAMVARVNVYGIEDSIESHYQRCKQFWDPYGNIVSPQTWQEAKDWQKAGRKPFRFIVNGKVYPLDFLSMYYKLLWVKYFEKHPELVEFAKEFDEFTDMFKGKNTMNCQADVIRQYIKEGKESLLKECQPLSNAMKGFYVREVVGNLLEAKELVIGHQVNCLGVMGAGLAKAIREKYPVVFEDYEILCKIGQKSRSLMGQCQMVEILEDIVQQGDQILLYPEGSGELVRIVANLFGQHGIGAGEKQTEEPYLKEALMVMKEKAMEKGYSVALPYQLGSGLAGADWNEILRIIKEVFCDYPVTIYRLPGV